MLIAATPLMVENNEKFLELPNPSLFTDLLYLYIDIMDSPIATKISKNASGDEKPLKVINVPE